MLICASGYSSFVVNGVVGYVTTCHEKRQPAVAMDEWQPPAEPFICEDAKTCASYAELKQIECLHFNAIINRSCPMLCPYCNATPQPSVDDIGVKTWFDFIKRLEGRHFSFQAAGTEPVVANHFEDIMDAAHKAGGSLMVFTSLIPSPIRLISFASEHQDMLVRVSCHPCSPRFDMGVFVTWLGRLACVCKTEVRMVEWQDNMKYYEKLKSTCGALKIPLILANKDNAREVRSEKAKDVKKYQYDFCRFRVLKHETR